MLGGDNENPIIPYTNENLRSCQTNTSNQLQLFGHLPTNCGAAPVNFFGNEHINPSSFPNKNPRDTDDVIQPHKLQISLNYNRQDEGDRNHVSTGLRLSYDDEERNSSVTSASGSMAAARSILFTLDDNLRTLLDQQNEEFDKYIKTQEEQLSRGVKGMKQRHVAAFVTCVEKDIERKLMEKDAEIESVNRKNRELVEKVNRVAMEAQQWHCRAQYNESVANALKANLQQVMASNATVAKEGFGDSEVDDTASCVHPGTSKQRDAGHQMVCRMCRMREVCVLVIPCRHLCLCWECNLVTSVCPVCRLMKSTTVQVLLS